MGYKKKQNKKTKEAQRAEQERQVQQDQQLKQAKQTETDKFLESIKILIGQKCKKAQQENNDEYDLWIQRLKDPMLTHIEAIKAIIREAFSVEAACSRLEIVYQDFVQKYPDKLIKMRTCVIKDIDTSFSLELTKNVLNILEINLSEIPPTSIKIMLKSQKMETANCNVTFILMHLIYKTWKQDAPDSQTKAEKLLELFISKQLPLNEKGFKDNALVHCITNYRKDIMFIKMLLESKKCNVNEIIISPETIALDDKEFYLCTPFSLACSYQNTSLMELLLEHGAEPHLAAKEFLNKIQEATSTPFQLPAANRGLLNHDAKFKKLSPKEQQDYYVRIDAIIKNFFLKKAEEFANEALKKEDIRRAKELKKQAKTERLEKKKSTEAEKTASSEVTQKAIDEDLVQKVESAEEQEPSPQEVPAETEALNTIEPEIKTPETAFLDRFIDSQEQSAKNQELPEEIREGYKFDSLVLRYIQTRDDSVLTEISAFLSEEHSAKNSNYYITVLTELGTSIEDASTILASMPKLLHKFCTVQKEIQTSASSATEQDEQNFGDDVYHIEGTKIFLQVDPELMSALPGNYKAKIHTQLSNPKFIAKNSFKISGVKDYGRNISKLKIAQTDENLVSTIRYKDSNGNLLIIFNQFLSHQETEALKQGTCIQVEGIQEIIHSTITKETSVATESVSHDTDSLLADSSTHCDDDLDQVALSGEDSLI